MISLKRLEFLCYLVQCLVSIVPNSAYYQTSDGRYTFLIPGFNDAEKRTQADAQTWCTRNQSQLLEITNDDIQRATVSFINNAITQYQMTGNNVVTNGHRFTTSLTWVKSAPYASSLTVKGQEPGLINSYGYLNSSQSGFDFYVDSPIAQRGYICEGPSFCDGGFKTNGRCYKSSGTLLSWFDARNQCTAGGGDLASFEFIANTNGFNALNSSGWNPPNTYWIGLRRQNWTWQGSNAEVVYSQWSNGHPTVPTNPNFDCLCLLPNTPNYDFKWGECDCSLTYQFVCMTAVATSISSSTQSTSYVRMTPSVASPSSVSISGSTSSSSTTVLASSTAAYSNFSGIRSGGDNNALPIGLGVGIGGGVLLIAVILVVVFVIVKRKGCPRKLASHNPSFDPPDVTPESYYAQVVKNSEYETTAIDPIPPPTEYADLNIVTVSQPHEDRDLSRRSLV